MPACGRSVIVRRALLDTHVVIDLGSTGGLEAMPRRVRRVLEDFDVELFLSVASQVEVAMKSRIGKLQLTRSDFEAICINASISLYPIRHHHADKLFELPLHHKDPFDQLIISTAICDDPPVISRDQQFRKYKGLRVIW